MKEKKLEQIRLIIREEIAPLQMLLRKQAQPDKVLNRKESMALLKVSSTTMWKLVKNGILPYKRIQRKLVFLESQLLQYIKDSE